MKLLILCSNLHEAKLIIEWLKMGKAFNSDIKRLFGQVPDSHFSYIQSDIEIDLVITGNTMMDTAFQLGRILTLKKFHLVLQAGLCGAYDESLQIGEVVSVINDKPGDIGILTGERFMNAYEAKLYSIDVYPHNRNGFINMTNTYFNVFLDIKKVAAVTVNTLNGGGSYLISRKKDFNIHVETSNGLGCAYACLFDKQPFYQLRSVCFKYNENKFDEESAISSLSDKVMDLIGKIA